jgi:hypothetical protein
MIVTFRCTGMFGSAQKNTWKKFKFLMYFEWKAFANSILYSCAESGSECNDKEILYDCAYVGCTMNNMNGKKSIIAGRTDRLTKGPVSVKAEPVPSLPHEQDASADSQRAKKRKIIQQASTDIKRGLRDTDRGEESDKAYRKLK